MADRTDWMPPTWGGKRAMAEAIRKHISEVAAQLDLSAAEVAEIEALANEILAVIDYYDNFKAANSGIGDWRDDALSTGDPNGALPAPPNPGTFTIPTGAKRGAFKTLRKWRDKWTTADGWSDAIAELLEVATPHPDVPTVVKPDVVVIPAQSGNFEFVVTVTGRGDAKSWKLKAAPVGTADWHSFDIMEGRTVELKWPNGTATPVQLQCQVQLYLKNEPYGTPSDIVLVTVTP